MAFFDASRSELVFQHLLDPERAFDELMRVTKPGGQLVVIDNDWATLSIDSDEPDLERRLVRFNAAHMMNNPFSGRHLRSIFNRRRFTEIAIDVQPIIAADGTPHWGCHGAESADKWGDLSKDFATCKLGKELSPIDIETAGVEKAKLEKIEFSYLPSKLNIANNGHAVQFEYDKGSSIKIGKDKYDVLQFHFHTPSEEVIDGKEFDLVAHLVHKSADGKLAVVAVLFDRGDENKALKTFWDKLPRDTGEVRTLPKTQVNAADMLPTNRGYLTFDGSLTTPPCSQDVRWFVLKNPVTLSKDQTASFRKIYPLKNRPVQPLNGRKILAGGD